MSLFLHVLSLTSLSPPPSFLLPSLPQTLPRLPSPPVLLLLPLADPLHLPPVSLLDLLLEGLLPLLAALPLPARERVTLSRGRRC